MIREVAVERLTFADVQATLGEDRAQAAFDLRAHLLVAFDLCAQMGRLLLQRTLVLFEFVGTFCATRARFEFARLAFKRGDRRLQAFDLAREFVALLVQMITRSRRAFGLAQLGLDMQPLALSRATRSCASAARSA